MKLDPSKKQNCGENRPIKMGKNRKYNLNFIDWDNEFNAVYGGESESNENLSKIKGMSMEIFMAILNEEKEFDL